MRPQQEQQEGQELRDLRDLRASFDLPGLPRLVELFEASQEERRSTESTESTESTPTVYQLIVQSNELIRTGLELVQRLNNANEDCRRICTLTGQAMREHKTMKQLQRKYDKPTSE